MKAIKELSKEINNLSNAGQYQSALKLCDQLIELNPNFMSYATKGTILQNLKLYEEALQAFDIAIGLDPKSLSGYTSKGKLLNKLKDYEQAIQLFNRAIELYPDHPDGYFEKARALMKLGQAEEALKLFDHAVRIGEDYPLYHRGRAQALAEIGKHQEAITEFDTTLKLYWNDIDAQHGKGNSLAALNRPLEAIKVFSSVLDIEEDILILCDRAKIYSSMGNHNAAHADYQKVKLEIENTPELLEQAYPEHMDYILGVLTQLEVKPEFMEELGSNKEFSNSMEPIHEDIQINIGIAPLQHNQNTEDNQDAELLLAGLSSLDHPQSQ